MSLGKSAVSATTPPLACGADDHSWGQSGFQILTNGFLGGIRFLLRMAIEESIMTLSSAKSLFYSAEDVTDFVVVIVRTPVYFYNCGCCLANRVLNVAGVFLIV